jgi:hypothetical protein
MSTTNTFSENELTWEIQQDTDMGIHGNGAFIFTDYFA